LPVVVIKQTINHTNVADILDIFLGVFMFPMRAAAAAVFALMAVAAAGSDRLAAGFSHVPPLHYSDVQGRAAGFVVDVLDEAARREGIEIAWTRVGGSTDVERALTESRIDIFPAGVITEARRAQFSSSEPWWSEDVSILARTDLGIGSNIDWRGRRIVLATPTFLPIASRTIPGARFEVPDQYDSRGGPEVTASMLCEGKAEAALMAHSEMDEVLLRRPPACVGLPLQIFETAESVPLAMISRRETATLAKRLRDRIDLLALDGTLANIARRYPRIPVRSAVMLSETLRLRYHGRLLWMALAGALLLATVTIILLVRQSRVQVALRRAITEQSTAEQALRSRTEELTVSNEELQAFAYSISHDIQEPLRMISLYTQMFERRCSPTSPDGHFYLKTIRGGAVRMQEMIDKLLLLSRVGRSDAPRVPVALDDVLSSVLQDFEPTIQSTSAQITIGPMPTIAGWPDRLSVLFQNLIGNALKYRREGVAPRIEITATQTDGGWEFAIRDNGIGFQQEYADRIFGVFKRLHVNDRYGGTGVGLAIAKRVVERHGGRIWAEGRPNEGSTFYFNLAAQSVEVANAPIMLERSRA
jgi:signal transduction histidine kinase